MKIFYVSLLAVGLTGVVSCSREDVKKHRELLEEWEKEREKGSGDVGEKPADGEDPNLPSDPTTPGDPADPTEPAPPPPEEETGRVAGNCETYVYKAEGRHIEMPGKKGRRNYASGKPSEVTWESEKNVDDSWSHYELTAYFKLGDGDDNAVFKMYGGNHSDGNKGWYVYGITNDGDAVCGGEDEHPSKNPKWKCTGGEKMEFGRINDKRVGLKTAIWTDSKGDVTVESYFDDGSGKWVKMASQTNPEGRKFKPKDPQNLLLRADGFEDIKVECATAQEIVIPN
jgi:hypothetical protein